MASDDLQTTGALSKAMVVALLVAGIGCGGQTSSQSKKPKTYEFQVEVQVSDNEGNPVAEAPVQLDGKTVGYTDKTGKFEGVIEEKPGTEVELALGHLDGYRYVDDSKATEVLELKPSLSGEGRKGVPVLLKTTAKSIKRHYLIWVQAHCKADVLSDEDCQGLEAKRDGEVVATTDQFGTAHFHLREKSGAPLEVAIEHPTLEEADVELTPKTPTYQFETALESTVYLLEPTFTEAEAEKEEDGGGRARRQRRRRRQPTTTSSSSGSNDSSGRSGSSGGGSAGSSGSSDDSGGGSSDDSPVELTNTGGSSDSSSGGEPNGGGGEGASGGGKKKKKEGVIDLFGD